MKLLTSVLVVDHIRPSFAISPNPPSRQGHHDLPEITLSTSIS